MTPEPPCLTITDLSHRWRVSIAAAWEIVRTRGVPFLWLGQGEPNLNRRGRRRVLFRPDAVEAWERGQQHVWSGAAPDRPARPREPRVTIAGLSIGGRLTSSGAIRKPRHA